MLPKIQEYLSIGVEYVWVVDPQKKSALIYSPKDPRGAVCDVLRTENPTIEIPLDRRYRRHTVLCNSEDIRKKHRDNESDGGAQDSQGLSCSCFLTTPEPPAHWGVTKFLPGSPCAAQVDHSTDSTSH
jgi:hypothetical protein